MCGIRTDNGRSTDLSDRLKPSLTCCYVGRPPQGFQVALGIELKGWYVLSKESMPSFRYSVTQAACTRWDLLAVVPWHLSNVLAGTPRVGSPWIWPAQHAAAYRNWWWQHGRTISPTMLSKHPNYTHIKVPAGVTPYQQGSNQNIADRPAHDGGKNFGRIARIGIMDDWVEETLEQRLAGIPANDWIRFLKRHA